MPHPHSHMPKYGTNRPGTHVKFVAIQQFGVGVKSIQLGCGKRHKNTSAPTNIGDAHINM